MTKCFFCGETLKKGRGKMFVKIDSKILYFCNSKCQKNHKLKRQGKKTLWTKTAHKLKDDKRELKQSKK